jgi:hypothetical protein
LALLRFEAGDMNAVLELTRGLDPARHSERKYAAVWLTRASALCATGHADEALGLYSTWLDKYTANHSPYDPGRASRRARMGLCALSAGKRPLARELSALASEALARQPEVAEVFKAPVLELARKLRGP